MTEKTHLPIDDYLEQIVATLKVQPSLVITAAPGAGKTTRLPPALLQSTDKKIYILEPRRMAAIAAAARIAEENNWELGTEVGYQVRFQNKSQASTRIVFMTEALLARQMLRNPELTDVGIIVLDEFHERSAHVDLALGLIRELQDLGRDIKIVVMSATIEAQSISEYLQNAPVISVPGKLFELEVIHQKNSQLLRTLPAFYENLNTVCRQALAHSQRDCLIFLPGVGEIERAKNSLSEMCTRLDISLVELHGSLPLDDQRKVLKGSVRRRVILSTNIAESSVTIDGVDTVIDSGLAKTARLDLKTGFSRLELGRISLSSANQRAGRAARQYPGKCYRLWNKQDEFSFQNSEVAEIHRVDLSESLLFLAAQGVTNFDNFSWFEKPHHQTLQNSISFLKRNRLLSENNILTDLGRSILNYPVPVRLGLIIHRGQTSGLQDLSLLVCSILQERDFLKKEALQYGRADKLECDLLLRVELFKDYLSGKKSSDIHFSSLKNIEQSYRQLQDLTARLFARDKVKSHPGSSNIQKDLQTLLQAGFSDRLCRRRQQSDKALMVGGRGVRLHPDSIVEKSEFFFALQGQESGSDAETSISLASGLDKADVFNIFSTDIRKNESLSFNEEKGGFQIKDIKVLFDLPLEESGTRNATAAEIKDKLPEVALARFDQILKNSSDLNLWWNKLHYYLQQVPDSIDLEALKQQALQMACYGASSLQEVQSKKLVDFFLNSLDSVAQENLQRFYPDRIKVPSGSHLDIIYSADKAPYLEVRIQEIFGWTKTPEIGLTKTPLTIHLLGPNFRPVQVTSNLESFWKNGYPEVRKELRIKYPKHQWPENPADGVAEAKGRRRF